jgi:hypothetical protein
MRPEEIRRLLVQSPFQPFRLYVLETTAFDVRHPELVIIARSTLTIYDPPKGGSHMLAERRNTIALLDVSRLELVVEPPPLHGNGEATTNLG